MNVHTKWNCLIPILSILNFVYFGQVLAVSSQKMLPISNRYM